MYIFGGWVPVPPEGMQHCDTVKPEWRCTNTLGIFNVNTLTWEQPAEPVDCKFHKVVALITALFCSRRRTTTASCRSLLGGDQPAHLHLVWSRRLPQVVEHANLLQGHVLPRNIVAYDARPNTTCSSDHDIAGLDLDVRYER